MEIALVVGGVVLVLAVVGLVIIIILSKAKGAAEAAKAGQEAFEERRQDADEVLSENVADEVAWLERQIEVGRPLDRARSRERLRELQRLTGRGPGRPVQ